MATLDYVDIPVVATRLKSSSSPERGRNDTRPAPVILTSLPQPNSLPRLAASPAGLPSDPPPSSASPRQRSRSPTRTAFSLLPQLLFSTLPTPSQDEKDRAKALVDPSAVPLMSNSNPLSIPITTVNFRRFVAKVGPIFWVQDRVEEVVMWRRGWKVTLTWMAIYSFLCYYPQLVFLLPQVALISVLIITHPRVASSVTPPTIPPPPPSTVPEGSVDWQRNLQAIQNLMGTLADLTDLITPHITYLTHASPLSSHLLTFLLLFTSLTVPVLSLIPLKPMFLVVGLTPFLLTHPYTQAVLIPNIQRTIKTGKGQRSMAKAWATWRRWVDDDVLSDAIWKREMREVELWENERWGLIETKDKDKDKDKEAVEIVGKGGYGWSKGNLRVGERSGWTRGRDGWSPIGGGVSSNLTFSLEAGWRFVETEDWRPDLEGSWSSHGSHHVDVTPDEGGDANGWVYTNDSWQDPHPAPMDHWIKKNVGTRRRRWVRRVYFGEEQVRHEV